MPVPLGKRSVPAKAWGSSPRLSAMEAEPDRRTGTVSKADRTARCGGQDLQLPPDMER